MDDLDGPPHRSRNMPVDLGYPNCAENQATIDRMSQDLRTLTVWMQRQSESTEKILIQQSRIEEMLQGAQCYAATSSYQNNRGSHQVEHGGKGRAARSLAVSKSILGGARSTFDKTSVLDPTRALDRTTMLDPTKASVFTLDPTKASVFTLDPTKASVFTDLSMSDTSYMEPSMLKHSSRHRGSHNFLQRLTENKWFEYLSAFAIILHCVFIGAYVEYTASHSEEVHQFIKITNDILVVVLVIEVSLKLAADRLYYFTCGERLWNFFDVSLVLLVIANFILSMATSESMKTAVKFAEIVRAARALRIFRILNCSRSFKVVIAKIFTSISILVWVMILVGMAIFTLAVVFTQGSNDFLAGAQHDDQPLDARQDRVSTHFGTVARSAFTLFKAITCGIFWGDVWNPLLDIGGFYAGLFIFYIALTEFALLNIITGVFVDASMQSGMHERDLLEEKQRLVNEKYEAGLIEVFEEIDGDGNNLLSLEEFEAILSGNSQLKVYLQALAIDVTDARKLFRLLDRDGSGHVELHEFLDGCKKIRGEAKSADIQALLKDTRWMRHHIQGLNHRISGVHTEVMRLQHGPYSPWGTIPKSPRLLSLQVPGPGAVPGADPGPGSMAL